MFSRKEDSLEFGNDYLGRQVKQLAQAVARLVLGVKEGGKADHALAEVRRAAGELLGVDPDALAMLDPASAALMLRETGRIRAYAEIVSAESEIHRLAGSRALADRHLRRAQDLLRLAGS